MCKKYHHKILLKTRGISYNSVGFKGFIKYNHLYLYAIRYQIKTTEMLYRKQLNNFL